MGATSATRRKQRYMESLKAKEAELNKQADNENQGNGLDSDSNGDNPTTPESVNQFQTSETNSDSKEEVQEPSQEENQVEETKAQRKARLKAEAEAKKG